MSAHFKVSPTNFSCLVTKTPPAKATLLKNAHASLLNLEANLRLFSIHHPDKENSTALQEIFTQTKILKSKFETYLDSSEDIVEFETPAKSAN